MLKKISQNFVISPLKFCLISQILIHSLWHVWTGDYSTTSSVSEMIIDLGLETLLQRCTQAKLVMMYRITHSLIDIQAPQLLHPAAVNTRGHSMHFLVPYCRIDDYRCSFFPSGISLWNQLPESIVTAPTLETYKGGLAGHLASRGMVLTVPQMRFVNSYSVAMLQRGPCTYWKKKMIW